MSEDGGMKSQEGEAIIISFVIFFSFALLFQRRNTSLHFCFECDKEMNELETMKATMTNYEKLKNELLFGQIILKPPTCRLSDTFIKIFLSLKC